MTITLKVANGQIVDVSIDKVRETVAVCEHCKYELTSRSSYTRHIRRNQRCAIRRAEAELEKFVETHTKKGLHFSLSIKLFKEKVSTVYVYR